MCGKPVRECGFWQPILESLSAQLHRDLLATPYSLNLGFINAQVLRDRHHQTPLYRIVSRARLGLQYSALLGLGKLLDGPLAAGRVVDHNLMLFDTVRRHWQIDTVVDSSKSYLKALQIYRRRSNVVRIMVLTQTVGVFTSPA